MTLHLQRRELIQGIRGIAIILVVAHHAVSNFDSVVLWNNCANFFNTFHINLFFFVAGYLFMNHREKYEKQGFHKFMAGKIKSLFLPYYASTFLFSVCIKIAFVIPKVSSLLQRQGYAEKSVFSMITDPFWFHAPYFTSLWFIYVLFIYFMIAWVQSKRRITVTSVVMIILSCMIVDAAGYPYFPEIVFQFIRYYPYFMVGMMLSERLGQEVCLDKKTASAALVCFLLAAVRVLGIDLSFMQKNVKALYIQLEGFVCSVSALIVFAVLMEALLQWGKGSVLTYVGDQSYRIYLIHNPWVLIPVAVVSASLISSVTVNIVINFVLGLAAPLIMVQLYQALLRRRGMP